MDSGLYKSLAEFIKNNTKNPGCLALDWMLVHISPLLALIRFNTEILEAFKYSNHLLRAPLSWTHQNLGKQKKKNMF